MRTKVKCLTSVFLAITMLFSVLAVAPMTVNASENPLVSGDYEYQLNNDNTCTITRYTGKSEKITVPSILNGHKVISIGYATFVYNGEITSVSIPDGVKEIGSMAFEGCQNLKKVTLPDTIKRIESRAFSLCPSLSDITIPYGVEYVGQSAFYSSKWYDNQPSGMIYVGKAAYEYKGTIPENAKIILRADTKCVTAGCFASSENLSEVVLPQGLLTIGEMAFAGCTNLRNVTIPDSVTSIEEAAFRDCEMMTEAVIPKSVNILDDEAFAECVNIEKVTVPDSVSTIGQNVFEGTKWLDNQPDGMVYIGTIAYKYKGDMPLDTTFSLKSGTKIIAGCAFSDQQNLEGIVIPDTVKIIGESAFGYCGNLKSVSIGNGVTDIGSSAFDECISLENITIPDSVTRISDYCFRGCTALKSIKLSDNLENLEECTFEDCVNIENITIPDSVKAIGYSVFGHCDNLKGISIGNGLSNFEKYSISECPSLEKITVSADNKYFSSEDGVMYNKGKTQIIVYPQNKKDAEYTVPDTVTIIGYSDYTDDNFIENSNLKTIIIPKSVKVIKYQSIGFAWNDDEEDRVKRTDFTVKGYCSTQAEYYAKNLGLNFVALDSPKTVPAPKITKLENTPNGIRITWDKVEGADAYRLYKMTASGWKRVYDTIVMPSTVDADVTVGKTETYTVRCLDLNGNTISGFNSKGWSKTYNPVAPTITQLDNTYNGIKVTWNKIAGVYGYRLYKMTSSGWKRIKDTTSTSFVDTNVSGGRTEKYTVRCIDKKGNTISGYNSKGWSKKFTTAAPMVTDFADTAGGIKLTWDKIPGAYGYRIYTKTSSGWKRIKDTTSTSFTDSAVTPYQSKTYTMRCIDKNGNTVSGFDSSGWSHSYFAVAPKITKLTNTSKGVSATWNKVAGVYGYRLYRKYDGGNWTRVKDTTSTTLIDSGAKKGKKVTYTVRCIDKDGKTVSGYNLTGWSITRK